MKNIKRLLIMIIVLMFFVTIFQPTQIKAETTTSENGKGTWTPTKETYSDIYGMSYLNALGETSAATNVNGQQINLMTMKTDGVYSKLVNWGYQGYLDGYSRVSLSTLAKDYEAKHPGWIVLGGINADQYAMNAFYASSGNPVWPQPFYPLTMDYERRFAIGLFGNPDKFVGVTNDSSKPFIYESPIKGYYLYLLDENNNVKSKYPVNGFNQTPSDGQTTVWSPYLGGQGGRDYYPSINGTNNLYIIELAELAYVSNCPDYGSEYAFFGRGEITKRSTSAELTRYQFAVDSSNVELLNNVAQGDRIIVQADYVNDELNEVECTIGFHSAHRQNGVDVESNQSYDTATYSRSIFGRKADGSYAIVTVDMYANKYKGMTHDECNAMLAHYGITEAYQQDGGGSVHAVVRDEYGNFKTVNQPKEGTVRNNFNGLFFVVRDPGLQVDTISSTRNSITIVKKETQLSEIIENVKVTVNNQTYDMEGDSLVINNLQEDTEYKVVYSFEIPVEGKENSKVEYSEIAKTEPFIMPSSGLKISEANKNSLTVTRSIYDYSGGFRNIVIQVGDSRYEMGTLESMVIEGLIDSTTYEVVFEYDFYEEATGNTYHGKEQKTATTLSFELPAIETFKVSRVYKDRVLLQYTYKDNDNRVTAANIVVNGVNNPITSKSGTYTVNNMDFENEDYVIYFEISYVNEYGSSQKIKSEEIVYSKTANPSHNIIYNLDGGVNESDAPSTYTEGTAVTLPIPTKEGYTFLGWYSGETKIESIKATDNTDIEVTAKWQKVETPDPTPTPTPTPTEPEKKGCSCKKSMEYLMSFTTLLGLACFLFRKKK